MALILNIDTCSDEAFVCLALDDKVIATETNPEQKNHAAFLQPAIQRLMHHAKKSLADIDAIAVVSGPGSYTGLRVGLASAKGLCYALNKPLVFVNTLYIMAYAAKNHATLNTHPKPQLFCPMVDARRMEVFTCLYNDQLELKEPPQAMILNELSFIEYVDNQAVLFFGNGSEKFKPVVKSSNALFANVIYTAGDMAVLSHEAFEGKKFQDLAYSVPEYIKDFFVLQKKH
ncbi:tRNA (adenosine(37)-N6)-threonylcarbamoyltransferase complex dimerization subunit type 1 TsaB [Danxiaibacter flavus]|uniref:tRNA (Adenosine(37)-N6)-threonylcarbamoyltransferase complex dimerization subunit type 1 TsaB n=1 Tax=Danxiaibacter flavus TaxID=3049108 RepID=A0ABV3ZKQ8_9BACT|nr:tRNA (adenosine(37)-N6)-threonylcarbamoyltransferase complex dimerization subunit type 1 TsaB [Chitinophagaceae bacterium DXS]